MFFLAPLNFSAAGGVTAEASKACLVQNDNQCSHGMRIVSPHTFGACPLFLSSAARAACILVTILDCFAITHRTARSSFGRLATPVHDASYIERIVSAPALRVPTYKLRPNPV